LGVKTEIGFAQLFPGYFQDFGFYERALNHALTGESPYFVRAIGSGYLYPPHSLLIIEVFHYIKPVFLKFLIYSTFNVALMILTVTGTARYYGYSAKSVWYWYVFCLGFVPFLELLHVGQINTITLFGIFLFFLWLDTSPVVSGFGLSLAMLTKVTPAIFLANLAVTKKFRVIAFTAAWVFTITILYAIRYGISPVLTYPEMLQWLSNQFVIDNNSQSLVSKLVMTFGFAFEYPEYLIVQRVLMLYIVLVLSVSSFFTIKGKQPKEPLFIVTALGMTVSPNVMWYHHYVFVLLPIMIWMGWMRLDARTVNWCLAGLFIIQIERFALTHGLLIHIFIHISMIILLLWQIRHYYSRQSIFPAQGQRSKLNDPNTSST
jgi:hypothetical protein